MRSSVSPAAWAVVILATTLAVIAQDNGQSGAVPDGSALRGLGVAMRESPRFTDATGASHGGERRVVVTSLPQNGPLQKADVHAGDWITEVVVAGTFPPLSIATVQDLFRAASLCATSCLIHRIDPDPQKIARQGFVLVGLAGGEWELQPGGRGFVDKKSKTTYSAGPIGSVVVTAEKAPAGGASPPGPPPVSNPIIPIRSGPHTPAPRVQATAAELNGQAALVIENGTTYLLTVYISGPLSETLTVMPGKAHMITLAPGTYEIAASVTTPNVLPFYGTETLSANMRYAQRYALPGK